MTPPIPAGRVQPHPMLYGTFSAVYRSARIRARMALGLLALVGVISLLTLGQDLAGFDILRRAEAGTLTDADAVAYDDTVAALAAVYLLAFAATAIAYLAWLSRTVDNVPVLTGQRPSVTPRWSIGWWFVPLANLVKPYLIVRDLVVRLRGAQRGSTGGVLAWWLFWLATNFTAILSLAFAGGETLDELRAWFTVNVIIDIVDVVAVILAVVVVRRVQGLAEARAVELPAFAAPWVAGHQPPPPPPCPRCGAPRFPGQQFCGNCGLDLWRGYGPDAANRM